MKQNMGLIDRVLRIIAAIAVIVLYFANYVNGTTAIILLVLAGVFVVTGFIGYCPLYSIFGINTCAVKSRKQQGH
jgi:hypothetical protein